MSTAAQTPPLPAGPLPVHVALVFRDQKKDKELSPMLRAAVAEAEAFYNSGRQRIQLNRYSISETPPTDASKEWVIVNAAASLWRAVSGGSEPRPQPAWQSVEVEKAKQVLPQSRGQFTGTCDGEHLVEAVCSLTSLGPPDKLIILVDQKIVPPEGYIYIIGNSYGPENDKHQSVISLTQLDPAHWNIRDPKRLATIKHRIRSLLILYIGDLLGLKSCHDPACFFYDSVDNPESFDATIRMGADHIDELQGKGFNLPSGDEAAIQPIADNPKAKGRQQLV